MEQLWRRVFSDRDSQLVIAVMVTGEGGAIFLLESEHDSIPYRLI